MKAEVKLTTAQIAALKKWNLGSSASWTVNVRIGTTRALLRLGAIEPPNAELVVRQSTRVAITDKGRALLAAITQETKNG